MPRPDEPQDVVPAGQPPATPDAAAETPVSFDDLLTIAPEETSELSLDEPTDRHGEKERTEEHPEERWHRTDQLAYEGGQMHYRQVYDGPVNFQSTRRAKLAERTRLASEGKKEEAETILELYLSSRGPYEGVVRIGDRLDLTLDRNVQGTSQYIPEVTSAAEEFIQGEVQKRQREIDALQTMDAARIGEYFGGVDMAHLVTNGQLDEGKIRDEIGRLQEKLTSYEIGLSGAVRKDIEGFTKAAFDNNDLEATLQGLEYLGLLDDPENIKN
jgi:hypothetical protein